MHHVKYMLTLILGVVPIYSSERICNTEGPPAVECAPYHRVYCTCGCVKYEQKDRFVVNCTGKGFKDTAVLQTLPPQTEVLIFTGNSIDRLPWNVFGMNNNSHLKIVDMSNNGLKEILGKSYHRVSSVERLILNHNDLKISRGFGENNKLHPRIFSNFESLKELHLTNAFADNTPEELAEDLHDIFVQSNLTQLIKLHLEQNEIRTFKDPRIFCDLPSLMDIHLGNNLLGQLDFDVQCLKHLRFIDLEYNNISFLSPKDLEAMDALPSRNQTLLIDLSRNPIVCDCNIKDFLVWLSTTKVKVRNVDMLVCVQGYPEVNKGHPIATLTDIKCGPNLYSPQIRKSHATIPVLIGFLVCLLIILFGTLMYMNRIHLRYQLTPILDSVSRKVQYTSIGKQEQEMDV